MTFENRLPPSLPSLPADWEWKALGDLVKGNRSICYGIVQPGKHDPDGVPMVNSGDILNSSPRQCIEFKVSKKLHNKFQRSTLRGREVLITLVGANFGQVAIAPESYKGFNCSRPVGVVPVETDPEFAAYALQTPLVRHFMDNWANMTAQPTLNLSDVAKLPVVWPPKKTRKFINEAVSKLDRKHQLNRQTNQTLEHIAQALFKSWFVDFEPTRAKIAAKQAGQDPERAAMAAISGKTVAELGQLDAAQLAQLKTTAALFPDGLVESELGEVPEGWEVGTLADLSQLNSLTWTKKSKPDELWYVDLANTKHGVIEDINYYSWEDAPSRARRVLRVGDTIVGTVRPGNRSFSFIGQSDKQLTASTGFAVLTPNEDHLKEFIYLAATSDENIDRLAHLADGGAYPAVRPDVVPALDIAIPNDTLINRFSLLTKSLFEARNRNLESENSLKNVRDTLLPKLLSGELSPTQTEVA